MKHPIYILVLRIYFSWQPNLTKPIFLSAFFLLAWHREISSMCISVVFSTTKKNQNLFLESLTTKVFWVFILWQRFVEVSQKPSSFVSFTFFLPQAKKFPPESPWTPSPLFEWSCWSSWSLSWFWWLFSFPVPLLALSEKKEAEIIQMLPSVQRWWRQMLF